MNTHVPRIAEKTQAVPNAPIPRIGEPLKNHWFTLSPMNYKSEIGRRIRESRKKLGLTLEQVSQRTGDVLTLKRINAYENGDRMPGPDEAVVLAKALGQRSAYLMALDDPQTAIEEKMIRNWRTLNERERMEFYRQIEALAMASRDPVQDATVELHIPPTPERRTPRVTAHKRVKSRTVQK